jgi:hypothetical protein
MHRSELVQIIQSCGINFQIWKWRKKDGFGDSFENIEWTILNGSNMINMIIDLPDVLEGMQCLNDFLFLEELLPVLCKNIKSPKGSNLSRTDKTMDQSQNIFSGQGVEKFNDDIQMIYYRKSNKNDATKEVMKVVLRKRFLAQTMPKNRTKLNLILPII